MTNKSRNRISLTLNLLIFILSGQALLSYFFKTGDGNMQVMGVTSLRYFTNLSNYFVAIVALIMAIEAIKNAKDDDYQYPHWLISLKLASTVSVTVTFLTCVVFLGPITGMMWGKYMGFFKGYLLLFRGNVFYLHFLSPVLSMISLMFLDRSNELTKRDAVFSVIPVIAYGLVYYYQVLIVGSENGGWPDFYSFTFGGKWYFAVLTAIVMPFATYLLGNFERKIYNAHGDGSGGQA